MLHRFNRVHNLNKRLKNNKRANWSLKEHAAKGLSSCALAGASSHVAAAPPKSVRAVACVPREHVSSRT
jgi:hypothetical protein